MEMIHPTFKAWKTAKGGSGGFRRQGRNSLFKKIARRRFTYMTV